MAGKIQNAMLEYFAKAFSLEKPLQRVLDVRQLAEFYCWEYQDYDDEQPPTASDMQKVTRAALKMGPYMGYMPFYIGPKRELHFAHWQDEQALIALGALSAELHKGRNAVGSA
ncbi:hypothetical protein [Chelativorans xinjiangense]|uniref:hypothetical protein n=1 Tax=Chelativorans xinjiangense TaxID=2681485 RepID=UPI00135761C8|nr:hypothetical protein [Chelativorans xinjiangense]